MFLSILVGTILGILSIGFLSFRFTQAVLQKSIMDNQLVLAKQTLNKIDRLLYERIIDIQQIAGEEAIKNFLTEWDKGSTEINVPLMKLLSSRMNELSFVTGPWDVLFVVDRHGKVLFSANEKLLGDEINAYPFKAIAYDASIKGEVYYSDLVISKDTGRPTIIFSVPIRSTNSDDPILGVVVGNFSWPAVLEILDEAPIKTVLFNREGKLIGTSDALTQPELLVDMLKNGPAFPQFISNQSQSIILPKSDITPEKTLSSIAIQSGYLSYKGSGWRLVFETPVFVAFAPATQAAAKLVLLITPIVIAASGLFFFMIVVLVLHPISNITRTINAIKAGDLTQQVPVRSEDELGNLAIAFNSMTSKLKNSYETLEKKVEERTSELLKINENLVKEIESRRRLEKIALQSEKLAAVGQLAAGVAHEINNPLGVILGFSQGMVKRLQPGDPQELPLKSIEREALRCKSLVQNLLTFSRQGKAEKEEININETIENALALVMAQTKVKDIQLIKELTTEIPRVFANRNQIQQVIVNLSNNAMDSMPSGGMLTVRTNLINLGGKPLVEIQVSDTGQGIPKEIQSSIFEPFFTTKEVGKGTGLGLSLIFEIIQKHAGQITVESQVGKGSTFKILLPLE